jgi:hypothetical protein
MRNKLQGKLIILTILLSSSLQLAYAKEKHNQRPTYTIRIPRQMAEIAYVQDRTNDKLYYDTTAGIIMMISKRETKFKSVNEYIDCSQKELENYLRACYGDTSLQLINCSKPPYYPEKSAVVNFRVKVLPFGMDTYTIYFIHHRREDMQISFTYKQGNEKAASEYINKVMQGFRLL